MGRVPSVIIGITCDVIPVASRSKVVRFDSPVKMCEFGKKGRVKEGGILDNQHISES